MNKKAVFLLMLGLMILFSDLFVNKVKAAQVGDTFSDENGFIFYEVTSDGYTKTCAVTGWKNDCVYVDIPEKIIYENTEYTVTEIKTKYAVLYADIKELKIPSTVKKIHLKNLVFTPVVDDNWIKRDYEDGIKFVFECPATAFEELKELSVYADAISSRIFVPEKYLTDYRNIFAGKTHCMFSDNDIAMREYTGIPIAAIGDADALPEGFICDSSYYKILDSSKKTVSLLKKPVELDPKMNGNVYVQPSKVSYKGVDYTVTKIEYYAFCDAHRNVCYGVKLPSTITKLESKSFGWQITSLDLSETKVTIIPSNLFNKAYDEYGYSPKVKRVILPECCKKICKKAFYNCKKMKSISLPAKLKSVGNKAFPAKLEKIYLQKNIKKQIL